MGVRLVCFLKDVELIKNKKNTPLIRVFWILP